MEGWHWRAIAKCKMQNANIKLANCRLAVAAIGTNGRFAGLRRTVVELLPLGNGQC
jgi:hypothetical protein